MEGRRWWWWWAKGGGKGRGGCCRRDEWAKRRAFEDSRIAAAIDVESCRHAVGPTLLCLRGTSRRSSARTGRSLSMAVTGRSLSMAVTGRSLSMAVPLSRLLSSPSLSMAVPLSRLPPPPSLSPVVLPSSPTRRRSRSLAPLLRTYAQSSPAASGHSQARQSAFPLRGYPLPATSALAVYPKPRSALSI